MKSTRGCLFLGRVHLKGSEEFEHVLAHKNCSAIAKARGELVFEVCQKPRKVLRYY